MIVIRLKGRNVPEELDMLSAGDTILVNGRPRKIIKISGPLERSPKNKNYKNYLFKFRKVNTSRYPSPYTYYNRWDLSHKYGGLVK